MKPKMIYRIVLRSLFRDIAMGILHDCLLVVTSALLTLLFSVHAHSVFKAHDYYFFKLSLCLLTRSFEKTKQNKNRVNPVWICYSNVGSISAQPWTLQASRRASCLLRRVCNQTPCCTGTPGEHQKARSKWLQTSAAPRFHNFSVCLKCTLLHLFCSSFWGQPH